MTVINIATRQFSILLNNSPIMLYCDASSFQADHTAPGLGMPAGQKNCQQAIKVNRKKRLSMIAVLVEIFPFHRNNSFNSFTIDILVAKNNFYPAVFCFSGRRIIRSDRFIRTIALHMCEAIWRNTVFRTLQDPVAHSICPKL